MTFWKTPPKTAWILLLLFTLAAVPVLAEYPRVTAHETSIGTIYRIDHGPAKGSEGPADPEGGSPVFDGDTYSFEHQLGALIDGIFQCFSEHTAGMDDNTVQFDGLSELLDPYLDGTMPAIFEFETPNGDGTTDAFFNSFAGTGQDLFPEGFEDPATNTPLDAACIEIGIDDTLDSDTPSEVVNAMFEASGDMGEIIPPVDITSIFSDPFDGRMSLVFPGQAGQGINGTILDIKIQQDQFDPQPIFADGFESGDATSWTDQSP